MRIRKRPWHQEILKRDSITYVKDPTQYQGQWKQLLKTDFLHVEIGAGKGDYCINMAKQYPDHGFIAIEKMPMIGSYILKKADESIPNLKVIIADAVDISTWFSPQEIDIIHLNFSDPWPKKKHHKHRLTTKHFLDEYRELLHDDGQIIQKSDNRLFFQDSCVSFSQHQWVLLEIDLDFRKLGQPADVITEYERRFIDLGQPIYRSVWRKK